MGSAALAGGLPSAGHGRRTTEADTAPRSTRDRIPPGPGQESVWDYPRPPRVEADTRRVRVVQGGETMVDTVRSLRVLETSHPPTFYLPRADVAPGALVPAGGSSFCEWKGQAAYRRDRRTLPGAPGTWGW